VQEQAEEEQFGPLLVGELVKHGVNATDVKKLQVGFFTNKIRLSFFNDQGGLIHFVIMEPMLWIRFRTDPLIWLFWIWFRVRECGSRSRIMKIGKN
jgi:hypothetical protein